MTLKNNQYHNNMKTYTYTHIYKYKKSDSIQIPDCFINVNFLLNVLFVYF